VCEHCQYKAKNRYVLDLHLRKHTGERPFPCTVEGCTYAGTRKSLLQIHARSHSEEMPYKCEVPGCGFGSIYRNVVAKHMRARVPAHLAAAQAGAAGLPSEVLAKLLSGAPMRNAPAMMHTCPAPNCGYATKRAFDLRTHTRRLHRDGQDYKCHQEGCQFVGESRADFHKHLNGHKSRGKRPKAAAAEEAAEAAAAAAAAAAVAEGGEAGEALQLGQAAVWGEAL
jgi:hypothetical protein